jgi:hypothetical protein
MQNIIKNPIQSIKALNTIESGLGLITITVVLCTITLGTLNVDWLVNNPRANQMSFWTHFGDAVQFKQLQEFQ